MAVSSYAELLEHGGHEIEIATYGEMGARDPDNVALECMTCNEVLVDYDRPDDEPTNGDNDD